ncbi:hypothetical protein [Mesorhizobium sp. M1027]|uniref:hypothetical protein n=1 Tax=Mesorhizobium sp. M1027 TaxID=2957050 RepID=UPI00333C97FE
MKQVHFFALKDDLLPVLEAVERDIPIKYILMGQFPTMEFETLAMEGKFPVLGNQPLDRLPAVDHFLSLAATFRLR